MIRLGGGGGGHGRTFPGLYRFNFIGAEIETMDNETISVLQ